MRRHLVASLAALGALGVALWGAGSAAAQSSGLCRVIDVEMTPSAHLQIVVWLEDDRGRFMDTLFITRSTGSHGLGNRPGIMEFNSSRRWPYGRRTTTFPVWAHRHGRQWPLVVFQDGHDRRLSHPAGQSSAEAFYWKPLIESDACWDAQTCASNLGFFTDKGKFSPTEMSLYPPRSDLKRDASRDSADVGRFGPNPFDAVSLPSPLGGQRFAIRWRIPDALVSGNYTLYAEVNKERDWNTYYHEQKYPEPLGVDFPDHGVPYRGQPSIVYQVPFRVDVGQTVASTDAYAGYGDPEGELGTLFPPDTTITTGVANTGASRLLLVEDAGVFYRVRVKAEVINDVIPPQGATGLEVMEANSDQVVLRFVAPGDDDGQSPVSGYDIRYLAGRSMDATNFSTATPMSAAVSPMPPGQMQTVTISGLLPKTRYSIGVRAYDECMQSGPLAVVEVTTPHRQGRDVGACFVATAAYGSPLVHDVAMLRQFRDQVLRQSVAGELLVEVYYTFGPALAKSIEPVPLLRQVARAALAPIVEAVARGGRRPRALGTAIAGPSRR